MIFLQIFKFGFSKFYLAAQKVGATLSAQKSQDQSFDNSMGKSSAAGREVVRARDLQIFTLQQCLTGSATLKTTQFIFAQIGYLSYSVKDGKEFKRRKTFQHDA